MVYLSIEDLWNAYNSELKLYIMKHVSDKYEAEDILQEVGIRLQKNVSKIIDLGNVRAWLYRIINNLIVDYYRAVNKYTLTDDSNEIFITATTDENNYNKEAAECLLNLANYLPENYREAVIECDYNGNKQSILGQKWGLSNSGSKARVQRGRRKLKDMLLSCCEVKYDKCGNIVEFYRKDDDTNKNSCLKC